MKWNHVVPVRKGLGPFYKAESLGESWLQLTTESRSQNQIARPRKQSEHEEKAKISLEKQNTPIDKITELRELRNLPKAAQLASGRDTSTAGFLTASTSFGSRWRRDFKTPVGAKVGEGQGDPGVCIVPQFRWREIFQEREAL
ncbi:uncharacterized protein LOC144332976 isoform X2 [Macaca mulatta]